MKTIDKQPSIFDQDHYIKLIQARGAFIRSIVPRLTKVLDLSTALDAGCGVGFFADLLHDCGLSVTAFDGRLHNVEEARARYPHLSFEHCDIQDPSIVRLGAFDFVLCFGLLYHLENPFLAIRHLRTLTRSGLLLESMCLTDDRPILELREEPSLDDQSLTDVALYPSETCFVKMLYLAGFPYVYKADPLPDHEQFQETPAYSRRRTVLFASLRPVIVPGLIPFAKSAPAPDPWMKSSHIAKRVARRVLNFAKKPGREKFRSFGFRWIRLVPGLPLPFRLPFGAWWLVRNDHISAALLDGSFEDAEHRFVEKFLQPGMTVLDIGANQGYYTMLSSRKVGPQGKVLAFEPSPREMRRLKLHLRLNHCGNVETAASALGAVAGTAELHVVLGPESGCNSLRPPDVSQPIGLLPVPVQRLDDVLKARGIERVDFIKIDVEGAELSVLQGAPDLLRRSPRPVILAEVQDVRTKPWGYRAAEILSCLAALDYQWFAPNSSGELEKLPLDRQTYDGNFVAIPQERIPS
jgi:FkbM family methyltransferase